MLACMLNLIFTTKPGLIRDGVLGEIGCPRDLDILPLATPLLKKPNNTVSTDYFLATHFEHVVLLDFSFAVHQPRIPSFMSHIHGSARYTLPNWLNHTHLTSLYINAGMWIIHKCF